jgi:hypothetical protein
LADPALYVKLHVVLELVVLLRGQVPPFSLNPQPTRHYLQSIRFLLFVHLR